MLDPGAPGYSPVRNATFYRNTRIPQRRTGHDAGAAAPPLPLPRHASIDRPLALAVTCALVFVFANVFPLVS